MQVLRAWVTSTIISLLMICVPALAQKASMQLFAPDKGWALGNGNRLFLTEDNGTHWSDITPEKSAGSFIASVFFLDESRGWVLLTSDAGDNRIRFQVAATTDGGHSWSSAPVFTPKQYAEELGAAWVNFADREHGWVVLRKRTSSAFNMGRLFATQDGGYTWRELPQPPLGEPVHFANATDGWTDGDPAASGVYHSRDGGNTWQGVDLQDPSSSVPTVVAYGQIKIIDAKHVSIPVGFSPITDQSQGTLVLFTTEDGKNWKADQTLSLRNRYNTAALTAAVVDSTLITLPELTLTTVAPDGTINRKTLSGLEEESVVEETSFASPTNGWLRMSDGRLLSTTDGGETLILLEPGSAPRALPKLPPKLPRVTMRPIGAGPLIAPPMGADREVIQGATTTAALHYTERLGFDKQQSFSSAQMTTWWSKSPFFDVGFYVGGANYCYSKNITTGVCTTRLDPNIIATWVTAETNQGWGLMPIWVGLQAPCNTGKVTTFSSIPATAQADGGAEALSAISAMTALGLSGTVIFYDMESYTATAGSSCSLAVRAFLTGWVNGMRANGFSTTAVYGNAGPAQIDFSQVANLTQVWITYVPVTGNNQPRVTIWGLGSLADKWWNSAQRGHQFILQTPAITYGGLTATGGIDMDVENFQIPGGNKQKPYSWAASNLNFPTTFQTPYVSGINDVMFNATTGYNNFIAQGQIGQIVGTYYTGEASTAVDAYGFLDNKGSFTSITDPSSTIYTEIFGNNNKGEVVGDYCFNSASTEQDDKCNYTTAIYSGFLGKSVLATPSFVNVNGGSDTGGNANQVLAINDDDVAVGGYYPYSPTAPNTNFIYQNGVVSTLSLLSCPGQGSDPIQASVTVNAINGFDQLAGSYTDTTGVTHGFVYNLEPATLQDCISVEGPNAYATYLLSINNQGQAAGYYYPNNGTRDTCYFILDSGVMYATTFTMLAFNDAAQMVG